MDVIIQSRLKSQRLPGKIFHTFLSETILERQVKILSTIPEIRNIIIASCSPELSFYYNEICEKYNCYLFFGEEENVLSRYYNCAKKFSIKDIIRITSDNYLLSPKCIQKQIKVYNEKEHDPGYVAIKNLSHFGCEIFSFDLLRKTYLSNAYSDMSKEHVTWDFKIIKNKIILKHDFENIDHKNKITLDTIDDLVLLKKIERLLITKYDSKNYDIIYNKKFVNEIKKLY